MTPVAEKSTKGSAGLLYTGLYFVGMILLYVGERLILESPTARVVVDLLALAVLAVALGSRTHRALRLEGAGRAVERRLLALYLLGAGSLLLYFAQADFVMEWLRPALGSAETAERYQVILAVLWPILWVTAAVPIVFIEISYSGMDVSRTIELPRIQRSLGSGLLLAMTAALLFVVNYIASEYNEKTDLSYFKTTRPSESSKKMVQNLSQPMEAILFFPGANEVQEQAEAYFEELASASARMTVKTLDHAMEPGLAKDLGVSDNGVVLLQRGKQKEQIKLGTRLIRAKGTLKKLDNEFQTAFLKLSRTQKVAYLTVGHEERGQRAATDKEGKGIQTVRTLLQRLNYSVKDLGIGQGLASAVPEDATVVIVAGPKKPFMPAEVAALHTYLKGGGRMMVFLDPEAELDMADLLGPFGLEFKPVKLANERFHVRVTYTPADRNYLFTNRFSAHPSVSTLSRNSRQLATVLLGAGPLSEIPSTTGLKPQVKFTLHSMAYTWNDVNGNLLFNPPEEQQKIYELGAVVTLKTGGGAEPGKQDGKDKGADDKKKDTGDDSEMRLVVLGDADMISDQIIRNPGNGYFFADTLKWLGGEEEIIGETTSEEDVRIMHTRKEDQLWFYLTIFGFPSLVLVIGLYFTTSRRRRS